MLFLKKKLFRGSDLQFSTTSVLRHNELHSGFTAVAGLLLGRTSLTRSCDMWPGHLHQHLLGPCRTTRHSGGGGLSVLPALPAPSFGLRTLHTAARSAGNALTLLLPRPPTQTLHLVNARHSPVFMSDLASPGHTPRPPRPCDISLLHTLTVPGPLHS